MNNVVIIALSIFGVLLAVELWMVFSEFNKFCLAVAIDRGEVNLLESPVGGGDMGFNKYKETISKRLYNDELDAEWNDDLLAAAKIFGPKYKRARILSFIYVGLIIVAGLICEW